MEIFLSVALLAIAWMSFLGREQRARIALLGTYLGKYQIEKLMENLTQGYLRALGEENPDRRGQIWAMLATAEQEVARQFGQFASDFSRLAPAATRVSTLAIALPLATRLLPQASFDVRAAFRIHARGLQATADASDMPAKDKAFQMSAELFLMQHTCHWFCCFKATASARMQVRHHTPYAQVLAAVSPTTRKAYLALLAAQPPSPGPGGQ